MTPLIEPSSNDKTTGMQNRLVVARVKKGAGEEVEVDEGPLWGKNVLYLDSINVNMLVVILPAVFRAFP